VKKNVPMNHRSGLTAPVGRYRVRAKGCSTGYVTVTTKREPHVELTCPVP
jgi:hypothetical protein